VNPLTKGTPINQSLGDVNQTNFANIVKGYLIDECYSFKNKSETEGKKMQSHLHEPPKATFVESDSDGDVLFVNSTEKGSVFSCIFLL